MKRRKKKETTKLLCPHCHQVIHLMVESKARTDKRLLAKAERCKYYGTGLEYMPPQSREDALADIVQTLGVDPQKADSIRSTLQRSGMWTFDHLSKTYTGIKWDPEEQEG